MSYTMQTTPKAREARAARLQVEAARKAALSHNRQTRRNAMRFAAMVATLFVAAFVAAYFGV